MLPVIAFNYSKYLWGFFVLLHSYDKKLILVQYSRENWFKIIFKKHICCENTAGF